MEQDSKVLVNVMQHKYRALISRIVLAAAMAAAPVPLVRAADVCPNPGTTPPSKGGLATQIILSGTAMANDGKQVSNSKGIAYPCAGLTGWYDPTSKHGVTAGHGWLGTIPAGTTNPKPGNEHMLEPDIAARGCEILKRIPAPACTCGYCGLNLCCSPCTKLADDFAELGKIDREIVPIITTPVTTYNTDDVMTFPTTAMSAFVQNIGVPGLDVGPSQLVAGQLMQVNGGISCHGYFVFDRVVTNFCNQNGLCYAQLEEFSGVASPTGGALGQAVPGDSGAPMLSADGLLSFVGHVVAGTTVQPGRIYVDPITNIRQHLLMFGIGAALLTTTTPLSAEMVAQAYPTVSQSEAEAQNPDLWKAQHAVEAIIKRQKPWLSKIPHVTEVQIMFVVEQNATGIAVVVDKPENIREVEGKVPSQLEGVPVVVESNIVDAW